MKGAKANVIISLGIVSIFIAVFFLMFVFDILIYGNMGCLLQGGGPCTGNMFMNLTVGLFITFFLLVMIAVSVYIMFITIDMRRGYSGPKEKRPPRKGISAVKMIGTVVFFIASFFMLFVFDKFLSSGLTCFLKHGGECTGAMTDTFISGIFIMIMLLIMILSAAHVMVKSSSRSALYG